MESYTQFLERLAQGVGWRDAVIQFCLDQGALGVHVQSLMGQETHAGLAFKSDLHQMCATDALHLSDGSYIVYSRYSESLHKEKLANMFRFVQAVDQLLHDHQTLQSAATHDLLTHVYNRRGLQEWIDRHTSKDELGFVLILLDLDNFKALNDTKGHAAGDAVLSAFAENLVRLLRPYDVVARLGGDEFVVILDLTRYYSGLEQRLLQVKSSLPLKDWGVDVTMGVACYPENGKDLQQLLAYADANLYRGKMSGKGGIVFGKGRSFHV